MNATARGERHSSGPWLLSDPDGQAFIISECGFIVRERPYALRFHNAAEMQHHIE